MDIELERMLKETVVAYFKVLSRYLPGGTEENQNLRKTKTKKGLSKDSRSRRRDLNKKPLEYEAGVLTTAPRPSVINGTLFSYKFFHLYGLVSGCL
jgi:hypothetical protein